MFNLFKKNKPAESQAQHIETPRPASTATVHASAEGILDLNKGDILDLTKTDDTLKKVRLAAGWDVNDMGGPEYDLDLVAYMLDKRGRLVSGTKSIVYYGDQKHRGIYLDDDNLTGGGDGDDENIHIEFDNIPSSVERIVIATVIYHGKQKRQTFANVKNAYVRLVDEGKSPEKEICRYCLTGDGGKNTAVTFAELYRTGEGNDAGWSFKTIGLPSEDTITTLASKYR